MEKVTPTWLRSLTFDVPTTILILLLLVMIPAFVFDDRISAAMSAFGFDAGKVSHIWFLRNQYDYLKDWQRVTNLDADLFHVAELFIWLAIAIAAARFVAGITLFGTVEDARRRIQKWRRRPMPALLYFLGWLFLSFAALAMVMTNVGMDMIGSERRMNAILHSSPKTYIAIVTLIFCCGLLFLVEGALVLLQLNFGKHERVAQADNTD